MIQYELRDSWSATDSCPSLTYRSHANIYYGCRILCSYAFNIVPRSVCVCVLAAATTSAYMYYVYRSQCIPRYGPAWPGSLRRFSRWTLRLSLRLATLLPARLPCSGRRPTPPRTARGELFEPLRTESSPGLLSPAPPPAAAPCGLRPKAEAERGCFCSISSLVFSPCRSSLLKRCRPASRVQAAPDGERAVHRLLGAAQLAHLGQEEGLGQAKARVRVGLG